MNTADLITHLSADLSPCSKWAAARRLCVGIGGGMLVSLLLIIAWFGMPLESVQYTGIPAFTMKLAFAISVTAVAALLLLAAGRPGQKLGFRLAWLLAPPAVVGVTAFMEMLLIAPQNREAAIFGSTWQACLIAITLLSVPVFAGVLWAFRRLAPTRLRLAGFLAGLVSGSVAAVLYALYCPETTASFLLSWYSLGILTPAVIGAIAGPRLLRW